MWYDVGVTHAHLQAYTLVRTRPEVLKGQTCKRAHI
jgi:hypothetical protein